MENGKEKPTPVTFVGGGKVTQEKLIEQLVLGIGNAMKKNGVASGNGQKEPEHTPGGNGKPPKCNTPQNCR